jgi:hypothetical protein
MSDPSIEQLVVLAVLAIVALRLLVGMARAARRAAEEEPAIEELEPEPPTPPSWMEPAPRETPRVTRPRARAGSRAPVDRAGEARTSRRARLRRAIVWSTILGPPRSLDP